MKLRRKVFMSAAALAACAATLTTTTYAWYVSNSSATVTGVTGATAGGDMGNILLANYVGNYGEVNANSIGTFSNKLTSVTKTNAATAKLEPMSQDYVVAPVEVNKADIGSADVTKIYSKNESNKYTVIDPEKIKTKYTAVGTDALLNYYTLNTATGVYTKNNNKDLATDTALYSITTANVILTTNGSGNSKYSITIGNDATVTGSILQEALNKLKAAGKTLYTVASDVYTPVPVTSDTITGTIKCITAATQNAAITTYINDADTTYYQFSNGIGTPIYLDEASASDNLTGWHDADGKIVNDATKLGKFAFVIKSSATDATSALTYKLGIKNTTKQFTNQQLVNNAGNLTSDAAGENAIAQNATFYKDAVEALRVRVSLKNLATSAEQVLGTFNGDSLWNYDFSAQYSHLAGAAYGGNAHTYYERITGAAPLSAAEKDGTTSFYGSTQSLTLNSNVNYEISVEYWLEGADIDCFDSCRGQSFEFTFNFEKA